MSCGCATPTLALVTDMDAGAEGEEAVGQEEVFALFRRNTRAARPGCWPTRWPTCPTPPAAPASTWADGLDLTYEVP